MIEFDNVKLAFPGNLVLDGVSFKTDFHEKIAILGGSGEGKTVLLKTMLALIEPDEGRILINGEDITGLKESQLKDVRRNFSIVFQEGALFDSLSVRENVAFYYREFTKLSDDEIDNKVHELLRRVNVEEAIDLMPEELSGGMQRRVAIARSLAACEPRMILYDEATTGLDPLTADKICDLINDLSSEEPPARKGFIIVTHKVTDAAKVAERFMYLRDGKIEFDGNIDELMNTNQIDLKRFINELILIRDFNGERDV